MLVTLTSANSDNNAVFRCNFVEPIELPPKSSVALINASVNRNKVIQITDKIFGGSEAENTAVVKFANSDDYSTITIPVGDYSLEGLAYELYKQFNSVIQDKGYDAVINWSIVNVGEGDYNKLMFNWDWRGTAKAPKSEPPLWTKGSQTDASWYNLAINPVNTKQNNLKKIGGGNMLNAGFFGGNYIAEKNGLGNGRLDFQTGAVNWSGTVGIGYARNQFISQFEDPQGGDDWSSLIDWGIKLFSNGTVQVWETPNDDPNSNLTTNPANISTSVNTPPFQYTEDTSFRIELEYDGTVKYYYIADNTLGDNWVLFYTSQKKKTTPTDFSTNGLVPLCALQNVLDETQNPKEGCFVENASGLFHDTTVSTKDYEADNDYENAITDGTYQSGGGYADASDPQYKYGLNPFDNPNIGADKITTRPLQYDLLGNGNPVEIVTNSHREHATHQHIISDLSPHHAYDIELVVEDLDELALVYEDVMPNPTEELREKVFVNVNGNNIGKMEAKKDGGQNQTLTKTFTEVQPNSNGDIDLKLYQNFYWNDTNGYSENSQMGIRLKSVKVTPSYYRFGRGDKEGTAIHHLNGVLNNVSVGAPAKKITFEPRRLGKYIGFFQESYYSNSNNSSDGSVGTQMGEWYGDVVEYNGSQNRVMVELRNLPIVTANSQTTNRGHAIANIPRFNNGVSNLGNIFYEPSTLYWIPLNNAEKLILNYLDVELKSADGNNIDKNIFGNNSVIVVGFDNYNK